MSKFITMELYNKYKQEVLKRTNARQRLIAGKSQGGFSDQEIAAQLGLTEEEVIEIRCIAETEDISLQNYLDADTIKENRFKGSVNK